MRVLRETLEKHGTLKLAFGVFVKIQLDQHFELERFSGDRIGFVFFEVGDQGRQIEHVAVAVAIGDLERLQRQATVIEGETFEGFLLARLVGRAGLFATVKGGPFGVR